MKRPNKDTPLLEKLGFLFGYNCVFLVTSLEEAQELSVYFNKYHCVKYFKYVLGMDDIRDKLLKEGLCVHPFEDWCDFKETFVEKGYHIIKWSALEVRMNSNFEFRVNRYNKNGLETKGHLELRNDDIKGD